MSKQLLPFESDQVDSATWRGVKIQTGNDDRLSWGSQHFGKSFSSRMLEKIEALRPKQEWSLE